MFAWRFAYALIYGKFVASELYARFFVRMPVVKLTCFRLSKAAVFQAKTRLQNAATKKKSTNEVVLSEIIQLLRAQQEDRARARLEVYLRDQDRAEAYALLASYCDLLERGASEIDRATHEVPATLVEAVYSLLWATSYVEADILRPVQHILVIKKFGRALNRHAVENVDGVVSSRVTYLLGSMLPDEVRVVAKLRSIAADAGLPDPFPTPQYASPSPSVMMGSFRSPSPPAHLPAPPAAFIPVSALQTPPLVSPSAPAAAAAAAPRFAARPASHDDDADQLAAGFASLRMRLDELGSQSPPAMAALPR
jgi:hypothetical protein